MTSNFGSFVVDLTYVYGSHRISAGINVLARIRQDGTGMTDLFSIDGDVLTLGIDASFVYWKAPHANEIRACQLPDCVGGFRTAVPNQPGGGVVVADPKSGRVVWTNLDATLGTATVMSNIANPGPVSTTQTSSTSIATDGSYAYFLGSPAGLLYRAPLGTGMAEGPIAGAFQSVAVNSTSIILGTYYTDPSGNGWPAVYKVPLVVGGVAALIGYSPITFAAGARLEGGPIADDQFVYWVVNDYVTAQVFQCPVSGCGAIPTKLATVVNTGGISGIQMTPTAVFFSAGGTIFKVAK